MSVIRLCHVMYNVVQERDDLYRVRDSPDHTRLPPKTERNGRKERVDKMDS